MTNSAFNNILRDRRRHYIGSFLVILLLQYFMKQTNAFYVHPLSSLSSAISLSSGIITTRTTTTATLTKKPATTTTRRYMGNFFQDMIKDAFQNDENLLSSDDKRQGQLDGRSDYEGDNDTSSLISNNNRNANAPELTETQRRWRQLQMKGGTIDDTSMLENTKWELDLFLAGVPNRDPSNDLYGSKTNISSRDRKVGIDVPTEPSVTIIITLKPDGVCIVDESPFTTGDNDGQWKLSDDKKTLRFSIDVIGYSRTIQTKGTINKIFWSKDDAKTRTSQTSYNIPPGYVYGDINIEFGGSSYSSSQQEIINNNIVMNPSKRTTTEGSNGDDPNSGILRIEQSSGLLGATTKLIPCGRFIGRPTS